jgi:hypothetical protein
MSGFMQQPQQQQPSASPLNQQLLQFMQQMSGMQYQPQDAQRAMQQHRAQGGVGGDMAAIWSQSPYHQQMVQTWAGDNPDGTQNMINVPLWQHLAHQQNQLQNWWQQNQVNGQAPPAGGVMQSTAQPRLPQPPLGTSMPQPPVNPMSTAPGPMGGSMGHMAEQPMGNPMRSNPYRANMSQPGSTYINQPLPQTRVLGGTNGAMNPWSPKNGMSIK